MRFGPPTPVESGMMLLGCGSSGAGVTFTGALDDYTTSLLGLHCACNRLLSSYGGSLIRIRRASDDAELDIGYKTDGWLDEVTLAAFVGGSDWFITKVYDQSGNLYDLINPTAGEQPQGAFDANGRAYGYAPGAGFTTSYLATVTSLGGAFTDSTVLSVHSAAAYALDIATIRTSDLTERRTVNFSNALQVDLPSAGTQATLGGTNTDPYSVTVQAYATGHRMNRGAAAVTGTRVSEAKTLDRLAFGFGGGGPVWSQNSRFYCTGFWSADLGDTVTDEIQAIGETLLSA